MLNTWGQRESSEFRRIMLSVTGIAVSLFVVLMALYMIVQSNKKLNQRKQENDE